MMRHEVRKTGKSSSTRRPVEYEEFLQRLVLVQANLKLPGLREPGSVSVGAQGAVAPDCAAG